MRNTLKEFNKAEVDKNLALIKSPFLKELSRRIVYGEISFQRVLNKAPDESTPLKELERIALCGDNYLGIELCLSVCGDYQHYYTLQLYFNNEIFTQCPISGVQLYSDLENVLGIFEKFPIFSFHEEKICAQEASIRNLEKFKNVAKTILASQN